jgi:NAD(P)-dependent dehydrogenase (short-subunit alcohol dehydrogenase family)
VAAPTANQYKEMRAAPTCPVSPPSKPPLGAVEPSPVAAIVPESIAMLRGRHVSSPAAPGMPRGNKSEVVVVTGCSAGLGRAIAREFGRHQASVGLISRNEERLNTAKREIEQSGGRALVLPLDVADAKAVENAAQKVEQEFGPIDTWVNSAMVSVFSPVEEMEPEEFRRVTEVTYLGVVYGTLAALKRMRQRDRGSIVQVGSALAYRSIPLQAAYCAAKHAIVGFTDSLRCELIHQRSRIRVSIVQMPALNTPQFGWVKSRLPHKAQPVPPIFQPEVGARAVYWAAHHQRRELFVGSSTVAAIMGQKFIPGLLDEYLGRTSYRSQQYDGRQDPSAPNNLWDSVPGDFGAHGAFDRRAHAHSWQSMLDLHRNWLWALPFAASGLAGGLAYAFFRSQKQKFKRRFRLLKRVA